MGIDHRWWRLRFTARQGGGGGSVNVATLKVRKGAGQPDIPLSMANVLAPYVTVTSDGNFFRAFDTDPATWWEPGITADMILRFQRPEWIGQVDIQITNQGQFGANRLDQGVTAFELSWSDDGTTFTLENSFTSGTWTSLGQTQTFTGNAWTPPPDEAEVALVAVEDVEGASLSRANIAFVGVEMVDGGGNKDRAAVALVSVETIVGPPVTQAWLAFLGVEVIIGPANRRRNGMVQIIGG